jgi:predicted transposase YdaD
MQISKDALWKGIIDNLWDDFILFFFPILANQVDFSRGFEYLDTELQQLLPDNPTLKRHADKLIRVWFLDGEEIWFLIHIEVQGYQDKLIGKRTYECNYRIKDKYNRQVTCLVIYTDWNRKYHLKEYRDEFMGTLTIFRFNTYVLRDHSREELALLLNPFAAVMEAAWQHFDRPKNDQQLKLTKLDLIKRLLTRKIPKEKIRAIIDFIRLYTPFTNSENSVNFEEELITLTKSGVTMGLQEAVLDDVKKQGIQIGRQEGREEGREEGIELSKKNFILNLWELQEMAFEKIAMLTDVDVEWVQTTIKASLAEQGLSEDEAQARIDHYRTKFSPDPTF